MGLKLTLKNRPLPHGFLLPEFFRDASRLIAPEIPNIKSNISTPEVNKEDARVLCGRLPPCPELERYQ